MLPVCIFIVAINTPAPAIAIIATTNAFPALPCRPDPFRNARAAPPATNETKPAQTCRINIGAYRIAPAPSLNPNVRPREPSFWFPTGSIAYLLLKNNR